MSGWIELLEDDKLSEITEDIIGRLKDYKSARAESVLSKGPVAIREIIENWIWLRSEGIRPNSVRVILKEWFVVRGEKSFDSVLDDWYERKTSGWGMGSYPDQLVVSDLCWYLENYVEEPVRPVGEVGRPKREYPIEEMRLSQEEGMSYGEIAKKYGIPKTTVYRLLKECSKIP